MNVRRILEMGVDELASRSRQEASKLLERMSGAAGSRDLRRTIAPSATPAGSGRRRADPVPTFRVGDSGFFAGALSEEAPALMRQRFPSEAGRLLDAASSICEGRFDLLGHRDLTFGRPIDWHLDPTTGRRSPGIHWSRIDPLDASAVGDVKIVWELNRHQWLLPLGQAYRITGDERFAATAARYLGEWSLANPHGQGINWTSSLEAALRLISWCWAAALMHDSREWPRSFLAGLRQGIETHASHVARYLSEHFSPNTHLTGEALGLLYAAAVLPGSRASDRWRRLAARILIRECERQILPDGVYFERSTGYQRYTVETYLHFLILADLNGIEVPPGVRERVATSIDSLLAVRTPEGSLPQIGDSDGGLLLPLSRRDPDDLGGVFSTAATLLGRPDFAWASGGAASETLWLLGPGGLESFDAIQPSPPATPPSALFAEGGVAVMRSSWSPDAHQMVLDVGPIGCPGNAGHGHADLLSLQCAAFGTSYLVDPGTYAYAAEPGWRDHFRSSAAHNTLLLDGRSQAIPSGTFSWATHPEVRLRRWHSDEAVDYADAEHGAYGRPEAPIIHRRRVLFVKPAYWVVVDDVEGSGCHDFDLRFQFAPVPVRLEGDHWIRARGPGGRGLLMRVFSLARPRAEIREGSLHPVDGWVSPRFGSRVPAPLITFAARGPLPLRTVTLLIPVADAGSPSPSAYPVVVEGPRLSGLVIGDARDFIGIDDDALTLRRA